MSPVRSFLDLLQLCSGVTTTPSFVSLQTLLLGWVFAPRRTVTGMILAAQAVGQKHHSAWRRCFATAKWPLEELGLVAFELILALLPGTILLVAGGTLARKRGLKVYGLGIYHDPLLSSRKQGSSTGPIAGWYWRVLIQFPFAQRYLCLPVLFRLYLSQQTVTKKGGGYQTKPELLVHLLQALCSCYPQRRFHLLSDSAYGSKSVLLKLPANCDLTSRLTLEAQLYEPGTPSGLQHAKHGSVVARRASSDRESAPKGAI